MIFKSILLVLHNKISHIFYLKIGLVILPKSYFGPLVKIVFQMLLI